MGTIGAQFMSYDRYGKTSHKGAFGTPSSWPAPRSRPATSRGFANARPDLFGPELADFMKRAARGLHPHQRRSARNCRTSKTASSSSSDKDEFGMPLARIVHSFDQDAIALWNANFEEGLKIAKAAGAKEVWSGARHDADDPSASAAPSWARAPATR